MTSNLELPIKNLRGVGLATLRKLERLKIKTVKDLLFHFPHRYEDFSNFQPIADLNLGQNATVCGRIVSIKNTRTWKKRMNITEAIVSDASGSIKTIWFNQPFLLNTLRPKTVLNLSGKLVLSQNDLCLSNPAYEILSFDGNFDSASSTQTLHTGRLIPIYPETYGLTSRWLRMIIKSLIKFSESLAEPLPQEILEAHQLPDTAQALNQIHFPKNLREAEEAKARFTFEELFLLQLLMQRRRLEIRTYPAQVIKFNQDLTKKFVASLPFTLTQDQKKSAWQIIRDLSRSQPMNRLLQGDVGSGKTVVAVIAALNAAQNKMQTAFMAPTEILSFQHFEKIWPALEPFGIKTGILTSNKAKIKEKEVGKKELVGKIKTGEVLIIIGTHALIQKNVAFNNLALVIIDEQHRFGVEQRAQLQSASQKLLPHLLSMSATPIPRTLSLSLWGDLDISTIFQMPQGRKSILTKVIAPAQRNEAYNFIRKQIQQGRQTYVVCPLIDSPAQNSLNEFWVGKSEKLEIKSATQEYEKLSKKIFPDLKIGLIHGRLKPKAKEKVISAFARNEIQILVSTSIVEVGIDVPNATIMMIEEADRFGLASLYQFRGRVGRGKYQSFCFLFTDSPSKKSASRLKAITTAKNGFELAEKDLEIRGPGDFIGVRQSGLPDLAMASLNDLDLIQKTRQAALEILRKDPNLKTYPALAQKIIEFKKRVHLE